MYMKENVKNDISYYVRCDESGYGHFMIIKCKSESEAFKIKELCEQLDFVRNVELCCSESNEWNHSGEFYKNVKSFKKMYSFID